MLSFVWIVSLLLALIPYFHLWGYYKLDEKRRSYCGIRRSVETDPTSWARDFFFVLGFTVTGLTMIITYALIWYKVIHRDNSFGTNKAAKRNLKLFKLIVIIFGAFIICYFPNLLIRAIMRKRGYGYSKAIGVILIWLNCCINPIIYFSFNTEYRLALERLLGCKRSQPPPSSDHTSESS
ncbi:Gustatory receptor trehalose 1-like protein, partial [Dinothrombium tinctorium]